MSKVVAVFMKMDLSYASNFQVMLNLCPVLSQFLIGMSKNPDFLAFNAKSNVCNG